MGRIVTKVTVKNALDESKVRIFDALVDTGATLLTLPTAWKQDFGKFLTVEKDKVQLADQHEVDVDIWVHGQLHSRLRSPIPGP